MSLSGIGRLSLNELNDVDLNSYQALIDVFHKEGALKHRVDVRSIILSKKDLGM